MILFISFLYIVFVSDTFRIKIILINGNAELSQSDLDQFVSAQINNRNVWELQNNLIFTDISALRESMLKKFSLLKDVTVTKTYPEAMEIKVKEKDVSVIWCRTACFWLDEDGVAYKPIEMDMAKQVKPEEAMLISDDVVGDIKAGDGVADKRFLDYAMSARQALKDELLLEIDNIKTPGVITGEIWIKTKENWQIFFDASGNIADAMRLLKQALKEKITPAELSDLAYVDLRVKDKIYYLTNSAAAAQAASIEESKRPSLVPSASAKPSGD